MTGAPAGETATALVHRLAGEQALARGHRLLDPRALEAACARQGLAHDGLVEAAKALAEQRILDVRTFGPSLINLLRLTENGFRQHLVATRSDIDGVRGRLLDALREEAAQKRLGEALDLADVLGEPALLVEVLLDELRDRGEVVFTPIPRRSSADPPGGRPSPTALSRTLRRPAHIAWLASSFTVWLTSAPSGGTLSGWWHAWGR